jgi:hypothetical protein
MESVAPPGGVMLSESTARLVEHTVMLAEPEWVHIKGADEPVRARRLVAISPRDGLVGRAEASLVGRRWEMAAQASFATLRSGSRQSLTGDPTLPYTLRAANKDASTTRSRDGGFDGSHLLRAAN